MKKLKSIIAVALILSVIFVFTGCGCTNTSESTNGNNQNTTSEQNVTSGQNTDSNSSKTDNNTFNTKTANSDFEPTISLEQRKAVKVEDYINGKNFDLNGYAEALGFTKVDDPKGAVHYVIKRGDTKCFFTFTQHVIVALFDKNDGYAYQTDPLAVPTTSDAYIINTGSKEGQQEASDEGLSYITRFLSYLSTADNIEIDNLPVFGIVFKLEGSPIYYSNGVIKETGKIVETIKHK